MPRAPKTPVPPSPEPTSVEIEERGLDLSSESLETLAREKLTPQSIKALKKIAYYTAKVGLTLPEACMLSDVDYEKFQEEMKLEPLIGKIIKMKELEFKKDMLHTISNKARGGDDKLAAWLLERRYPEEYGAKKVNPNAPSDDPFLLAMEFIRKNGDSNPLVSETSGRAIIIKKQGSSEVVEKIGDILGKESFLPSKAKE